MLMLWITKFKRFKKMVELTRVLQKKLNQYFFETKIKITIEGRRCIAGSLGTQQLKDLYIKTKVNE